MSLKILSATAQMSIKRHFEGSVAYGYLERASATQPGPIIYLE
jgi:hypothetical protein